MLVNIPRWRGWLTQGAVVAVLAVVAVVAVLAALAGVGCGDDSGSGSDQDAGPGQDSAVPVDGAVDPDGGQTTQYDCQNPDPAWVMCEDFEGGGGDFDTWFAGSDFLSANGEGDRGRIDIVSDVVHRGNYAVHMPAAESSSFQGSGLDWRACDGVQEVGCDMRSFETLYFRAWIRFAADHDYVHHFLNIGGSQPDDYWYHGTAGCLPSGNIAMGTTVDFRSGSHETFFYTYFPDMSCDTNCGNYADVDAICAECLSKDLPTCTNQPQCCWGNSFAPDPPVAFPVDQWFCFEMTMTANAPGDPDGYMAYWVDGALGHEVSGMVWRISPTLALNRVRLQHYITAGDSNGHSNRIWFDDVVVSTQPIGCD